jgi:hypothetical protein
MITAATMPDNANGQPGPGLGDGIWPKDLYDEPSGFSCVRSTEQQVLPFW